MKVRMWLFFGVSFIFNEIIFNLAYSKCIKFNPEMARRVTECEVKFDSVCKKEQIFANCKNEAQLKKKYYLVMLRDFQTWLEQSKVILHTLQPDEVQQNMNDFNQTCQDYTKQISEYLYWVQEKTPPGGFSIPNPDNYYKETIQPQSN